MRWFRELRTPGIKCERVGHDPGTERREGYRKPGWDDLDRHFYVCVGVTEERPACRRCGHALGEWKQTARTGFNSYSWPADQAAAFDRDGEFWKRHSEAR